MKLSEAIRLGAMMRPQAFGNLFTTTGSCAWGAAYEAIGIGTSHEEVSVNSDRIPRNWLDVALQETSCPDCDQRSASLVNSIVSHLNDGHEWTRERIADWVETIEQQLEAQATTQPEVEHVTY